MIGGLILSLTVIGAIIGVPLILIGLFIMGNGIRFGVSEKEDEKKSTKEDIHSKMTGLKKSYEDGLITKKEFEESKKKLLSKI